MTQPTSDLSIDALRSGDRQEYSRLVETYSSSIYRLALRILGNSLDAEDVLQNTFLKAIQHIKNFEGRSNLSTWLYRIASNEALMLLRKKRPEVVMSDTLPAEEDSYEPIEFSDWCCLPEEEFISSESRQALDRAVQTLPETLRVVFVLRDLEGLSIQETSQALDLSETAVKTRLLRARLRLRNELSSYFSERAKSRRDENERA